MVFGTIAILEKVYTLHPIEGGGGDCKWCSNIVVVVIVRSLESLLTFKRINSVSPLCRPPVPSYINWASLLRAKFPSTFFCLLTVNWLYHILPSTMNTSTTFPCTTAPLGERGMMVAEGHFHCIFISFITLLADSTLYGLGFTGLPSFRCTLGATMWVCLFYLPLLPPLNLPRRPSCTTHD